MRLFLTLGLSNWQCYCINTVQWWMRLFLTLWLSNWHCYMYNDEWNNGKHTSEVVRKQGEQRRRINTEEKAKVVAASWGTEMIQWLVRQSSTSPHSAATTFAFSSEFILILWRGGSMSGWRGGWTMWRSWWPEPPPTRTTKRTSLKTVNHPHYSISPAQTWPCISDYWLITRQNSEFETFCSGSLKCYSNNDFFIAFLKWADRHKKCKLYSPGWIYWLIIKDIFVSVIIFVLLSGCSLLSKCTS